MAHGVNVTGRPSEVRTESYLTWQLPRGVGEGRRPGNFDKSSFCAGQKPEWSVLKREKERRKQKH